MTPVGNVNNAPHYSHYQILNYLYLSFLTCFALVCFFHSSCWHDSGSYCPLAMWIGPSWKRLDRTLQGVHSSASLGSTKFDDRHLVTCGRLIWCKHQNPSIQWRSKYLFLRFFLCWVMLHYVPKTVCLYLALQVDLRAWKARGKQNKLTIKNPVIWPNFWGQAKDSRTKHDQGYKRYSGIKVELSAGPPLLWKRDASCTVPRQVVESAATLFRTPRGHSKETCAKPCRCRTSMLTPSILWLAPVGNCDSFRFTFASQIPSPCARGTNKRSRNWLKNVSDIWRISAARHFRDLPGVHVAVPQRLEEELTAVPGCGRKSCVANPMLQEILIIYCWLQLLCT